MKSLMKFIGLLAGWGASSGATPKDYNQSDYTPGDYN